jgi:Rrf2 family protein
MKVSVKLEYACRVMAQLARLQPSGSLAHIGPLAEAEGIPPNYLVQILTDLREADLIVSRRGKQGGYVLARSPDSITICDIAEAVDGDLLEFGEVPSGQSGVAVRRAWEGLRDSLRERARAVTLEQLVPKPSDTMYFI